MYTDVSIVMSEGCLYKIGRNAMSAKYHVELIPWRAIPRRSDSIDLQHPWSCTTVSFHKNEHLLPLLDSAFSPLDSRSVLYL